MKIYIAGPVTGVLGYRKHFQAAEKHLKQLGHEPVNPTRLCLGENASWQDYMRASMSKLIWCEGVALLPDWEHSAGAKIERRWAESVGLMVLPLADWKRAK